MTATAFDGMADASTSVAAVAGADVRHDYNGDGRSDMAAWYDYGDGHDAVRTFFAGSNGAFGAPGTGCSPARTVVSAGTSSPSSGPLRMAGTSTA
ncbi:hypothetical protein [Streptomyces sp. MS191]|uniref:hypothetical protein n=1 Tax=Streptomyces sp. ms191 TaxID=1827978 RepID=UPI0021C835FB|nr:hypothetical protein [Streptomyces sp. ms191]